MPACFLYLYSIPVERKFISRIIKNAGKSRKTIDKRRLLDYYSNRFIKLRI